MHIKSVHIRNFKGYEKFDLDLNENMNILVGDNEAKKSTVLEAINLVLSGTIDGKYLTSETLNDYLFNKKVVEKYVQDIKDGNKVNPPTIQIDLHLSDDFDVDYEGVENLSGKKAKGLSYRISLRQEYEEAYDVLGVDDLKSIPLELYSIELKRFSGTEQVRTLLPIKNSFIDNSSNFQNASDQTISKILKEKLEQQEKIKASQFYRGIKDHYKTHQIHEELKKHVDYKDTTVSIDPSSKNSWDSHLSLYVKDIPFSYIGKGLQTILKTNVSLSSKKTEKARIILIEEPENHLSHTTLNELVALIESKCVEKQIIITSHSSYIVNKLGLENLILINNGLPLHFKELEEDTKDFFKKLPGYNTLRLLLCKSAILVEGDADELMLQRAYKDNKGVLPISNGIDVISVNNSYGRFLDLAKPLCKKVSLVVDLDNRESSRVELKNSFNSIDHIDVFFEKNDPYTGSIDRYNNNTLEPLILKYNSRDILNMIFKTQKETDDEILQFMRDNKTKCALDIFESDTKIVYPKYIVDAINFISISNPNK